MPIFQMKHLIKIENLKGTKRIRYLGRYYAYFSSEAHPLYFCQSVRLSVCPSVRLSICPFVHLSLIKMENLKGTKRKKNYSIFFK